ncbi:TMhelix containing protein [Vibrio phage 1.271.B._10N.286.54.B4]|nr:TMhelix containing protein [Vibrio phage 1.027.O._10N.286.54.B8]AUR94458.1 TMhelix containing protein [Vibrio phage 1.194.O._10N.286.54.B1]AUR94546.1 TMhelix containing protein [Vibrio phage 1.195.O._10N.286.54.C8]AUR94631.1 TMhelix containing protein [Vibrio phage 1.196.O._10N.286.54.E12]AUR95098.1 TMhelix containing protein [Vibrio phage 1.200.O._10N.286.55.E1]AUR99586.1 TMhelix containing protein [Vibrio phage 1.267.O._10N.286.54.A1]AUR99671.1 TMhelix containing protein [Vibrio phage 1.
MIEVLKYSFLIFTLGFAGVSIVAYLYQIYKDMR